MFENLSIFNPYIRLTDLKKTVLPLKGNIIYVKCIQHKKNKKKSRLIQTHFNLAYYKNKTKIAAELTTSKQGVK